MLIQRISQTLQMDTIMTWVKILITSQKISLFPPCQILMDIQRILALILWENLSPKFPRVMMLLAIVINWKVHVKSFITFSCCPSASKISIFVWEWADLTCQRVRKCWPRSDAMRQWCIIVKYCQILVGFPPFFQKEKMYIIVLGIELIRCVPLILNKEIEKKSSKCQVWPIWHQVKRSWPNLLIGSDRIGPMIVTLIYGNESVKFITS